MNVLVTGAGGFLGLYLVERLVARGDNVRALCRRRQSQLDALGVQTLTADLRDREATIAACRGVDVVFHVAGLTGIGFDWHAYYTVNTLGTQYIVEGCLRHRVPRLVYTSSPSVVFDGTDQHGIDESISYPKRWLCHYAHSKALAERHVLASSGIAGLLTCAMRPHLIWGPRDRQLIPRLLRLARRGRLRQIGDGTNLVDTIYVENAAAAHLQAADALRPGSSVAGQAYFISQGEPVNCWQFLNQILALAGMPPIRQSISFSLAWAMGAMYEICYRLLQLKSDPPMTRFLAAQLATSHNFNISRARRDFGYEPVVSITEGMRRLGAELVNQRRLHEML